MDGLKVCLVPTDRPKEGSFDRVIESGPAAAMATASMPTGRQSPDGVCGQRTVVNNLVVNDLVHKDVRGTTGAVTANRPVLASRGGEERWDPGSPAQL